MPEIRKIDIVIDAVILVLVTYYVADTLSDGQFSREVGLRLVRLTSRIKNDIERRRAVAKDTGRVIWDAIETIENRAPGTDDTKSA